MGQVHEQMAKVMQAVGSIAKEAGSGVSYTFRSVDAVMNHLHGPLAEHGLVLAPRVLDDWQINQIPGTNNRVQTQAIFRLAIDVYAADGSMLTLGPGLAQSHDYGDKAAYQAAQNCYKYLLLEAFAIPTSEPDMDAREADSIPDVAEQARLGTNALKAEALELVNGDKDEAAALWSLVLERLRLPVDAPITPNLADKVRAALVEVAHEPVEEAV